MKISHLVGAGLLAVTLSTQAQEAALPLWEVGLLGGLASTPSYPGSADRTMRALALPYLIYRGEVLRADRSGIGARLLHTDDVEFDVGLAASLPSRSTDTPARNNMPDLGTLVEFGPRLKMTLALPTPASRLRLEVPLRAVLELNSGVHQQGWVLEPELVLETRNFSAGWNLSVSGSLVLGDRTLNNYFYGVAPQFATTVRPAYDAKAGLIATRLAFSTSKELNPDLRVFAYLRFESYAGAANLDSPLHLQSTGSSVGLALAWTLGRSERRAASL